MPHRQGTKELIFDAFIELTSALGYENVGIRDITTKVGITPPSLYYHFESKGKLLEYTYKYYARHQYDTRTPADAMKELIETAGAGEIVGACAYTFESEDQQQYARMILITKIIYMRLFQDPAANEMFAANTANNIAYVTDILQHGVDIGRIDRDFDLVTFANILIGSLQIMGVKAFAGQDYAVGQLEQEKRILGMLTRLLATALR